MLQNFASIQSQIRLRTAAVSAVCLVRLENSIAAILSCIRLLVLALTNVLLALPESLLLCNTQLRNRKS
jgi:hypothetical protein